jgi:hypothetical protein
VVRSANSSSHVSRASSEVFMGIFMVDSS